MIFQILYLCINVSFYVWIVIFKKVSNFCQKQTKKKREKTGEKWSLPKHIILYLYTTTNCCGIIRAIALRALDLCAAARREGVPGHIPNILCVTWMYYVQCTYNI